jgi:hypothetical protein
MPPSSTSSGVTKKRKLHDDHHGSGQTRSLAQSSRVRLYVFLMIRK